MGKLRGREGGAGGRESTWRAKGRHAVSEKELQAALTPCVKFRLSNLSCLSNLSNLRLAECLRKEKITYIMVSGTSVW